MVVLIIVAHLGLALAYTLPGQFVPERLFSWGERYMRSIFHQQWNLFAPDPPTCMCRVEVGLPDGTWRPIVPDDRPYLVHRMARPLADHVQEQVAQGDTVLLPVLAAGLRGLVRDIGRDVHTLHFRLVGRCIVDPSKPAERSERITALRLPLP